MLNKSIPDKIADSIIKNTIDLERYSEGVKEQVIEILNKAQQEIIGKIAQIDPDAPSMTKWKEQRLQTLNKKITEILDDSYKEIKSVSQDSLKAMVKPTMKATVNALNDGIGVNIFDVTLTPEMLNSIATKTLINGNIIGAWWDKQSENAKTNLTTQMNKAMQQLQIGTVQGESINELISRIRGTALTPGVMSVTKREAAALVRTSTMQVANSTRMQVYEQNKDILKGYEVIATLDTRTTPLCKGLDRKQYDLNFNPIGHNIPYPAGGPPFHWLCRTGLCPMTKSYRELMGEDSPLTNKEKQQLTQVTSVSQRASMGGPTSGTMDYNEWLLTQSKEVQEDVLGIARRQLWLDNKLTMEDLIHQNGRLLTLPELEAKIKGTDIVIREQTLLEHIKNQATLLLNQDEFKQFLDTMPQGQIGYRVIEKAGYTPESLFEEMQKIKEFTNLSGSQEALALFLKNPALQKVLSEEVDIKVKTKMLQDALQQEAQKMLEEKTKKIVILGVQKTYNLNIPAEKEQYEKIKNAYMQEYKTSVVSGQTPTVAMKAVYQSLNEIEKELWDLKIEKAMGKVSQGPKIIEPLVSTPQLTIQEVTGKLDFDNMIKYDNQKGSNTGGFYYIKDNPADRYYVKIPDNIEIARNEMLASKLYQAAGVEVPELQLITVGDKIGIASRVVDDLSPIDLQSIKKGLISGVGDGFVVDAWLADWDVVGLNYDNLLQKGSRAVRIDVGGSLRFRAQGTMKGNSFGKQVNELDSMRNAKTNPQSAKIFKDIKQVDLENGVRKVLAISDEQIAQLVKEFGPTNIDEANKLTEILIARKQDIARRFPDIKIVVNNVSLSKDAGEIISKFEQEQIVNSRINGYGVRIDKEEIEDHNVLFYCDFDPKKNPRTWASMKVRDEAAKKLDALIVQGKKQEFKLVRVRGTFEKRELKNGFAYDTGEKILFDRERKSFSYYYQGKINDVTIRYWPASDTDISFALKGKLEVFTDGQGKATTDKILETMKTLGLDTVASSEIDEEILYLRQILYNYDPKKELVFGQKIQGLSPDLQLTKLRVDVSETLGVEDVTKLPDYNAFGIRGPFDTAGINRYRPDLAGTPEFETFREQYCLYHHVYGDLPTSIDNILNSGGNMISSVNKLRTGIKWGGMSPPDDMRTGGADYFFTRIYTTNKAEKLSGLVWDSDLLRRLDSISYDNDKYGQCDKDFILKHKLPANIDRWKYASGNKGNETIFKNDLSIFDKLKNIVCISQRQRDEVIQIFKKHKYKTLNGKKLEDIIIVAK